MTDFDEDQTGEHTSGESMRPVQVEVDELELGSSLESMSRLVTGALPLEVLLTRVAEFAVRAIPVQTVQG